MSQNNKKKSGKTFSQLTNIKYEFFFSLTFESNFLQMVTSGQSKHIYVVLERKIMNMIQNHMLAPIVIWSSN